MCVLSRTDRFSQIQRNILNGHLRTFKAFPGPSKGLKYLQDLFKGFLNAFVALKNFENLKFETPLKGV